MEVYWTSGNGPYLPTQGDGGANRRGGVAASPPASLLRPGYPPVTLASRYVVPGTVGAPSTYSAYVRQPQGSNPRLTLRAPYPFINSDGVQILGGNSLLAAHSAAALSNIVAPEAAHQLKRPRIDSRGGPTTPLTIDTRESIKETAGYQPQVEAISPTPEDRPAERDDIKSTKDDLLQKISKVDREIAKAESQIAKLKKKQEELEDAANKPSTDSASEDEKPNQSIAQNVYSENRRKASQSHASLDRFSPGNLLPLYNQPSDTEVYNNNKKEYTVFKKKLVEYFKKKNEENETRDRYMTVTYCKLTSVWSRKVDRAENSKKRREREGRSREMYEKLFPELRKQREDKERNERSGIRGTVRSDQEFQDVIERLQEHEMEEKKMHSYAVIPPPLLPPEDRKRKFTNNNGLIQDPLHVYNERMFVNMWTDAEKETFKEKYILHPKNFFMIAQYLERKSVSDCVQYYYLSKKKENYKQLLRKSRPRGGTRPRRINNPPGEVIAPNVPGVVTRRTVQGLQKEDGEAAKGLGSRSNTPQPQIKQEKESTEDNQGEKESGKGRKERGSNREKKVENDSSDDEDSNQPVKCGPHPCVVCKATVESSRAVPKERAGQIGLKEEDLNENSRVCNTCWCKTLRSKCPLLSCSTSSKGKKLRHLPLKWKDLPQSTKDTLTNELQIPDGTKQVCTTCFGRINKRISQLEDGDKKTEREDVSASWTDAEIDGLKTGLRNHGHHWDKIAETLAEKSAEQCKKYFYNMRKKLHLDKIVQEYKKANRPEGSEKPSLSSEEESGSSTSSAEEENTENNTATNQDKNKELKPPAVPPAVADEPVRKEDGYDSAATVSADETLEQDKNNAARAAAAASASALAKTFPTSVQAAVSTALTTAQQNAGQQPLSKTIYVKDLMNSVIDSTLRRPSNQMRGNEISSIKDLLHDPATAAAIDANSSYHKAVSASNLEVRAINAASSQDVTAASAQPVIVEDGALNLTTTKRDRSPPPHPGPSEPMYRPTYIENSRGAPGFGQQSTSRGAKPPEAHGDSKKKTTHKQSMMQDNERLKIFNHNLTLQSPNYMSHRPDPRQDLLKSSIPSLHKGMEGSITRGQPIPQHAQHPPPTGRYDQAQLKSLPTQRGSLVSGTPVYTDRRAPAAQVYLADPSRGSTGHPPTHPVIDIPKKQQQPQYAAYPRPPASHESRGSSSRSVIENDYKIAQTLPRKDQSDDLRGGFARGLDPRAVRGEVQIVDTRGGGGPRFDPRPPFYGSPRVTNPYSPIRSDPKADMPVRGDLHDVRGDPRVSMDPRVRPGFPSYPGSSGQVRDAGRRSPLPRSNPATMAHAMSPSVPSPRPGSITSGMPRNSVEIHTISRQQQQQQHPEVSITKQPVIPISRPDYPPTNTNLSNFADIALQQPKMREGEHRGPGSSSLTVMRTDPGSARLPGDPSKSVYDRRGMNKMEDRYKDQEEQNRMLAKLNQLTDSERSKYYEQMKVSLGLKGPPENLTTKNIIDRIIMNQMSKTMTSMMPSVSTSYPHPGRHTPQAVPGDGKESPSKQPSRSPSVKSSEREAIDESSLMLRTSPAVNTSFGDNLDSVVKKETQKNRTSPYQGSVPQGEVHEYWSRKQFLNDPNYIQRPPSQGGPSRPPSGGVAQLSSDERQIIRVAQNASPRPDKPPSRSMVESISPPNADPAKSMPNYSSFIDPMARFIAAQRKPHEVDPAAAKSSGRVFDYVKTKIAEAMMNDKTADPSKPQTSNSSAMGPPNKRPLDAEARGSPVAEGSGAIGESPRKRYKPDDQPGSGAANDLPDSPGSGEMVIDESARPDSAHSHKTASPAPHADPALYPGYRVAGQSLPPRSSPSQQPRPPPQSNSTAGARYESLSDDD